MDLFVTYKDIDVSQRIQALKQGVDVIAGFHEYRAFMGGLRDTAPPASDVAYRQKIKNLAIYLGNTRCNEYGSYTESIIKMVKDSYPHIAIVIYACDCEFKEKVALAEKLNVGIKKCACGGSDILLRLTC